MRLRDWWDERSAVSPLYAFFVRGLFWVVLLTFLWSFISHWALMPGAWLAQLFLEHQYSWINKISYVAGSFDVETWLRVNQPGARGVRMGMLVADTHPARYGFGQPLLVALLMASLATHRVRKVFFGMVLLMPFQAYGIVMDILKQAALGVGVDAYAQMGLERWQIELIALGYQAGILLLPALVPVMFWLILERTFFAAVVMDGLVRRQSAPHDLGAATIASDRVRKRS